MSKDDDTSPDRSVAAVERTVSLLNAFVGATGPLTLGMLEASTGLFKSAILRYMITLVDSGLVVRNTDGTYRLGTHVLRLADAFERAVDFPDIVEPALRTLVDETGESASFYVRKGDERICILRRNSPASLRVSLQPGDIKPLDMTSTGLVLREAEAHPTINGFYIRHSRGLIDPLTASISAPVFGIDNRLIGALTLSGPIGRFDVLSGKARQTLYSHARTLSHELGAIDRYMEAFEAFATDG